VASTNSPETIGLIAGNRTLPFLFAASAKQAGFRVAAIGFYEETDPKLAGSVDAYEQISVGQLGKLLAFFKKAGVRRAVMQGQIRHKLIYSKIKPDWRAFLLLRKMKDLRTESMLGAVGDELKRHGVELQPATWLMESHLAGKGVMGRVKPSAALRKDLAFGRELARGIGAMDIGQTVVVKRQSCVAVESIEGTDAVIERGGQLGGPGLTVVKLAKPGQDLRFDLPVVGPDTFRMLARVKAGALGLEAGKTLFLEKEKCLRLADQARMAVVAE
jgi:DUF1009 family protein